MMKKNPKTIEEILEDLKNADEVFYFGDDIEEPAYEENISYESAMEP